jgi:hypothetical protein
MLANAFLFFETVLEKSTYEGILGAATLQRAGVCIYDGLHVYEEVFDYQHVKDYSGGLQ